MPLFSERNWRKSKDLALLALPTAALAYAPDLSTFAALRIAQGLAMSTAFALTLSYLAEHCSMRAATGAFAAYVTGNVASNLFGRLMSASLADQFGLAGNFVVFALLNLAGAALAWFTLARHAPMPAAAMPAAPWSMLLDHWRHRALRASFAGEAAHALRLGFDADLRLLFADGTVAVPGLGSGPIEARYGDYRRVGGRWLPFEIRYRFRGAPLLDERVRAWELD